MRKGNIYEKAWSIFSSTQEDFIFPSFLHTTMVLYHMRVSSTNQLLSFAEKLSAHHSSCHGDRNHYRCHECDKTFFAHSRYKTHMMAAHTGERPFVCPECGKGFPRMYSLTTHMRYTHCDEKKFKCEVMSSSLSTSLMYIPGADEFDIVFTAPSVVIKTPACSSLLNCLLNTFASDD